MSPVRKKQEFVCLYEREDRSRCSDRATARSGSIAHIICPANEIISDVNAYIAPAVIEKLVGLEKWITEPPPNDSGCRGCRGGPKSAKPGRLKRMLICMLACANESIGSRRSHGLNLVPIYS